ncbi:MAG: ferrous iron transport protein A [Actinobacteria bacterium]|nr:ferrous iron transport protein A [Actinomycetota bacterium]
MPGITLDRAPLRMPLVLQDATGAGTIRRLAALGLRRGAEVTLLHNTSGGGRVALVGGTRVALGPGVLKQVQVEVAS